MHLPSGLLCVVELGGEMLFLKNTHDTHKSGLEDLGWGWEKKK